MMNLQVSSVSCIQAPLGEACSGNLCTAFFRSVDCAVTASVYLIICRLSSHYSLHPPQRTKTKYNPVFLFPASLFLDTPVTAQNNLPKALETPNQRPLLVPCFVQSQKCFTPWRPSSQPSYFSFLLPPVLCSSHHILVPQSLLLPLTLRFLLCKGRRALPPQ